MLSSKSIDGYSDIVEAMARHSEQIKAAEARAMPKMLEEAASEIKARRASLEEAAGKGTAGAEEIKARGNALFREGAHRQAEAVYKEALDVLDIVGRDEPGVGELRATVLSNRAECRLQARYWQGALSDVAAARLANPGMAESASEKLGLREKRANEGMEHARKLRSLREERSGQGQGGGQGGGGGNQETREGTGECEGECIFCLVDKSTQHRPLRRSACCACIIHPSCLGVWIAKSSGLGVSPSCPKCFQSLAYGAASG
jgi:hypothetical protein